MFARLEGGDGDGGVQMVGQRDGDGVQVGLVEDFVPVGVATRDVVTLGGFAEALRVAFGDGHSGGARAVQQAVEMVQADAPGSDDTAAKFVAHRVFGK